MKQILVIDDDLETCEFLGDILTEEGWLVTAKQNVDDARAAVGANQFDLIISDINLGGRVNGVALLKEFRQSTPESEVVLISGFGALDTAVAAVREGAFDYVSKPFDVNEVIGVARRALDESNDRSTAAVLRTEHHETSGLVGHSPKMAWLYKQIALVSATDSTVLISGESGVGKELVARAIHLNSALSEAPFVSVNCGALTETLLEAELFGHTRGSFTGAVSDKRGLFEEANGGTLFLDEIGETSPGLQVKLLRALQEGEIRRVGGMKPVKIHTRVLAATNRNLEEEVAAGRFREDLYYRLNVVSIRIPPLRERREDIPLLVAHMLRWPRNAKARATTVSSEVLELLEQYDWPGNVRELENTLEHAAVYARGAVIKRENLPEKILNFSRAMVHKNHLEAAFADLPTIDELEHRYLRYVLECVDGGRARAAEIMGVDRRTISRMIERYGLNEKDSVD